MADAVKRTVTTAAMQLVLNKFAPDRETALRLMHDKIEELLREECNPSS